MPQRFLIIVNPKSGLLHGVDLAVQAGSFFKSKGIDCTFYETRRSGDAGQRVQRSDLNTFDGVCAVGGDGTVHEVVNGIMNREDHLIVPVGVLPAGTGNALLSHLDQLDLQIALSRIVANDVRKIDLMKIQSNGRTEFSFNMVGWGMMAAGNRTAEQLRILGKLRYHAAALKEIICNPSYRAELTIDRGSLLGPFAFVTACKTVYVGNGMKLAPRADLTDGLMDVLVVRNPSRFQLLSVFRKVFTGDHLQLPELTYRKASYLSLKPIDSTFLNIDGELSQSTGFEIQVMPAVLPLLN
ncbi:MAG TPA: diacylglycerol kinase family lipid kinase [Verrucomicrobiales bacterium]|jgi:sphingosine kinase|nr:diacylglycerol kinase family lipid kinase [Verrucomicrobiales bacterium]HIL69470.1 diacylglycerol kinase family lipid kinase [Verrucomicrobiota bacterium]